MWLWILWNLSIVHTHTHTPLPLPSHLSHTFSWSIFHQRKKKTLEKLYIPSTFFFLLPFSSILHQPHWIRSIFLTQLLKNSSFTCYKRYSCCRVSYWFKTQNVCNFLFLRMEKRMTTTTAMIATDPLLFYLMILSPLRLHSINPAQLIFCLW